MMRCNEPGTEGKVRIGITGSWRKKDREAWSLDSDFESFKQACREIGAAIARTGSAITVGSDSDFTADAHAVDAYLSNYVPGLSVRVVRPKKGPKPFPELYARYPGAFTYVEGPSDSWRHTRHLFVSNSDAVVTVGGGGGTYQAALELGLTRKRLVPVGSFGGASSRLLSELLTELRSQDREVGDYEKLANPWVTEMATQIVDVLGAGRPSRILLIHGHANDRLELQEWLRKENLALPRIMGQQYAAGQTMPEKFEKDAEEADAAIALATPDDLGSAAGKLDVQQRARQNVWVEVGWFWGRLGRDRVMLLVRGDVEIPSDLDGIDHLKYDGSVLEREADIRTFLQKVSKRNQ